MEACKLVGAAVAGRWPVAGMQAVNLAAGGGGGAATLPGPATGRRLGPPVRAWAGACQHQAGGTLHWTLATLL